MTDNMRAINNLNSVKMLNAIRRKFYSKGKGPSRNERIDNGRAIAIKIFEGLNRVNTSKGSMLIVVYLPVRKDLVQDGGSNSSLRTFLASELSARGIAFIDLVDDLKRLPSQETEKMFISKLTYPYSRGHYSEAGNQYIANIIYKRLSQYLPHK
jgi:hypothetical protein